MVRSNNYLGGQKRISLGLVAVIISTLSFDGHRIIKERLSWICNKGITTNYVMLSWRAKNKMRYKSCG